MRAALTSIVTAAMLCLGGATAAAAAPQTPVPRATQVNAPDEQTTEDTSIALSAVATKATLSAANQPEFLVSVENLGSDDLAAGELHVRVVTEAATSVDALTPDALAMQPAGTTVAIVETPVISSGDRFSTKVSVDAFPLTAEHPTGVYLTQVSWTGEEGTSDTVAESITRTQPGSAFVWNGNGSTNTLQLATIVPVVFTPGDAPVITPTEANLALDEQRFTERLIAPARAANSLVALDPRLVATIRALGASATQSSLDVLEALDAGTLVVAPLTYGDVDPVAAALLEPDTMVGPTGLSFLTRHFTATAEQVESDLAHSPKAVRSLTDGSAPPTLTDLIDVPSATEGFAWPSPRSLTPESIAALEAQGMNQLVVGGSDASGDAKGRLGSTTLLHSHAALETAARNFLTATSELEIAQSRAQLASVAALLAAPGTAEAPAQALLAIDRELAATSDSVDDLFEELRTLPWISFAAIDTLREGTVSLAEPADLQPALDQLAEAMRSEEAVATYSRVLSEPPLLVDYQRDRLISLMSVQGPLAASEEAQEALETRIEVHLDGNERLLRGVSIVDTEHTRLLGSTSNLPIQIRNTLPFDATVTGTIATGSAALIVQKPKLEATVIPAQSTINHVVPVTSRASSGQVDLGVWLRDTRNGDDIASTSFEVTLSGKTETIALTTLGAIVALLFIGGVWRSLSRRRASR